MLEAGLAQQSAYALPKVREQAILTLRVFAVMAEHGCWGTGNSVTAACFVGNMFLFYTDQPLAVCVQGLPDLIHMVVQDFPGQLVCTTSVPLGCRSPWKPNPFRMGEPLRLSGSPDGSP